MSFLAITSDHVLIFLLGGIAAVSCTLIGLRFTEWLALRLSWMWLAVLRVALVPPSARSYAVSSSPAPAAQPHPQQPEQGGTFAAPTRGMCSSTLLVTQCACNARALVWSSPLCPLAVCLSCERVYAVSGQHGAFMGVEFMPVWRRISGQCVGGDA